MNRCKAYVSDTREKNKWAKRIKEGRPENQDSLDDILITMPRYRMQQRQRIYDELGELANQARETTDKDALNSLKTAAAVLSKQQSMIDAYEKGLRDQQRLDNAGGGWHGITIPETQEDPVSNRTSKDNSARWN